ncbi:unnamed protein product [marine sediment metagenome]|uniref:N-acetyltransferase domain-containing protein n=1 Tax=marine sediment metagenome TaxID=412755 RepID=X1GZS2_9ZZZZ
MSQKVTIRPARDQDLPRMKEIAVQAWQPIYADYEARMGEELFSLLHPDGWKDEKASQVADHFQGWPEWCLVAEVNGQIAGFITFTLDADRNIGEIGNNAVDPNCQGCGIGSAQYAYVLELFREEGMAYAMVGTGLDEAHAPARAAYDRVGFELMIPMGRYYRKL